MASRLRARGLSPLTVVTPELLHYSFRWDHRLSHGQPPSIAFTLADGSRIDGREVRGVLNRMTAVPEAVLGSLAPADRDYARQEWSALHVSWLSGLTAPVLNVPHSQGLCGAWRHVSEWIWMAGLAGLDTGPYAQYAPTSDLEALAMPGSTLEWAAGIERGGPARTVFVIDGCPVPSGLPEPIDDACGRLGALSKTRLIGVDVETLTGRFVGASVTPDLRLGGETLVEALRSVFTGDA